MARQFKRHNGFDIFIHWFNAACWLFLAATGLGLIDNPALNPLGNGYPRVLRALFGSGGNLLLAHEIVGGLWIAAFLLYLVFNLRGALFFLREVFSVSPARDMTWMLKKQIQMTMGEKMLLRLGLDPRLPPQGFYNMGQKAFAQAAIVGSLVIALSGMVMVLSQLTLDSDRTILVAWAIMLHYLAAGVVFAGLLVHVYMAAIAREERPAFISMFTGTVPEDYARHHHLLWYEQVCGGAAPTPPPGALPLDPSRGAAPAPRKGG
jgi:formate dehydrogenase subunit gamma